MTTTAVDQVRKRSIDSRLTDVQMARKVCVRDTLDVRRPRRSIQQSVWQSWRHRGRTGHGPSRLGNAFALSFG